MKKYLTQPSYLEMQHIGPLSSGQFWKMQIMMEDLDVPDRMVCLYNTLMIMKENNK